MKKNIILSTILSLVFFASTFATEINTGSEKVLNSFNKEFAAAKAASVEKVGDNYRISFLMNDQLMKAFYAENGEFLAVSRNLVATQLPLTLQRELNTEYSQYWITALQEYSTNEGTKYFVTLENADRKLILKSSNGTAWENFSKVKK